MRKTTRSIAVVLFSLASLLMTTSLRSSASVPSVGVPVEVEAGDTTSAAVRRAEGVGNESDPNDQKEAKSPLFALLRSAVIPGWGQFYTGHPYRGSFMLASETLLVAYSWAENNKANRSWDLYQETSDSLYFDEYEKHFDRGRTLMSFAIGLFIFNLADAYVSAHLYDFEDKVSFDQDEDRLNISMKWRFH